MQHIGRRRVTLVLLAVYGLLVALRLPNVWKGRFWAEEGAKFFVNAWVLPWQQALLAPWGGYLNITANIGGLLAWHLVPLAYAPYATTLLALAVQLCPAILLLTSRGAWLNRPGWRLAALLMVLAVPASEEVWLSSIGSQVHLSLCAGLILALEKRSGALGAFRIALLVVGGLSGPGPWLLTPLFLVRAGIDRSPARLAQGIALGATVLAQMLFFYSHVPGRSYAIQPLLFLDMAFSKHVMLPLLGPLAGGDLTQRLIWQPVLSGHPPAWPALAMACIGLLLVAAALRRGAGTSFWLLAAAVVLIGVSYIGVLRDFTEMFPAGRGGRYVYAPQVLIAIAVLAYAARPGIAGRIATLFAAWLLTVGIAYYFTPVSQNFAQGPAWGAELAWHRHDPSHVIRSWPPGWLVPLPDDTHAAH